ncbi:hypothetical protein C8J55DRAFT_567278 [Lentinula edodes]|uniref:Uncharacterized protein n=1 Tax=Lentinula lateritia TaxID=40482 RepID=A0A9W9DCU5_9AGAR|nr:hypothetical protein C8J55DRAFT_567278 [Lentinula edodes]
MKRRIIIAFLPPPSSLTLTTLITSTASPFSPIDKLPPSSYDIWDSDGDDGWQDMPMVHSDELRVVLDKEIWRTYLYRARRESKTMSFKHSPISATSKKTTTLGPSGGDERGCEPKQLFDKARPHHPPNTSPSTYSTPSLLTSCSSLSPTLCTTPAYDLSASASGLTSPSPGGTSSSPKAALAKPARDGAQRPPNQTTPVSTTLRTTGKSSRNTSRDLFQYHYASEESYGADVLDNRTLFNRTISATSKKTGNIAVFVP